MTRGWALKRGLSTFPQSTITNSARHLAPVRLDGALQYFSGSGGMWVTGVGIVDVKNVAYYADK